MVHMGEGHAAVAVGNGEGGGGSPSATSAKSAVGRQVDLDLPRTFPGNARVELCLPSLRRVLLAFAAHAPEVGYCQSMNFIAALLLVAVVLADDDELLLHDNDAEADDEKRRRQQNGNGNDVNSNGERSRRRKPFPQPARAPNPREEETAFWLLVALADDSGNSSVSTATATAAAASNKSRGGGGGGGIGSSSSAASSASHPSPFFSSGGNGGSILPPGMYGRDLKGCRVELGALARLLRPRQPKLAKHVLDTLSCDASLLATEWYLCLFATSLPAETTARLWDSLFVEGNKVLHRAALALLKRHSKGLLAAANAGAAMRAVRDGAAAEHDAEGLLATCFDGIGSLPMAKIEQARKEASKEVEREVAGRAAAKEGRTRLCRLFPHPPFFARCCARPRWQRLGGCGQLEEAAAPPTRAALVPRLCLHRPPSRQCSLPPLLLASPPSASRAPPRSRSARRLLPPPRQPLPSIPRPSSAELRP